MKRYSNEQSELIFFETSVIIIRTIPSAIRPIEHSRNIARVQQHDNLRQSTNKEWPTVQPGLPFCY